MQLAQFIPQTTLSSVIRPPSLCILLIETGMVVEEAYGKIEEAHESGLEYFSPKCPPGLKTVTDEDQMQIQRV